MTITIFEITKNQKREVIVMQKNNSKQIRNRQRISKKTLIIGIDIGSQFNSVVFMNKPGTVLKQYNKIYNSRKGFDFYQKEIKKAMKKNKLNRVIIGFEPTGHYWRKIADFSQRQGYD